MHRKHPGSGWRAQGRHSFPSPPGRGVRPRIGEGRQALCSTKMKLWLLATRGKAEVWKRSHPALGQVGAARLPVGYWTGGVPVARNESGGGIPSWHPACPYPSPRGRPPAPPSSAPASQPVLESSGPHISARTQMQVS